MTEAQIKKLQEQVEATRQDRQAAFITALAETHGLPADALTAVKSAFDDGHRASVALSEALDGQSVALSEKEADYDLPDAAKKELARVDLSDSVTLGRDALRTLLTSVAESARTQLAEGDTKVVDGAPPAKPAKGGVALSEFEGLTPAETVKKVNEAASAGKIK